MNNLKIGKNLIIISLLVTLAAAVSGCLKNNQTPITNNQDITNQEPEATSTPTATSTKTTCGENEQTIFLKDEEMDTSDWQTYRNEKYGYELKYPKEWDYDKTLSELYGNTDYVNFSALSGIDTMGNNPDNLDIQEWRLQQDLADWKQIICLNGIKAVTSEHDDLRQYYRGRMVLIEFSYNKKIFKVKWYDGERDNEEIRLEYKQFLKMLETFKFD